MSYTFRQKRKAAAVLRRMKEAVLVSAPRPARRSEIKNPSKIISMMAGEKKQGYWQFIKENHAKFGGPAIIRVEMAAIVAFQDQKKAEKRQEKRRRAG